jgi:hypothetical protein
MEDKRTPLTIAEGILDNIISIADKFITGLTSFGKKDISEQLESFAETLKHIPLEKRSLSKEEHDALLKIFVAAAQPSFAKQFMGEVNTEVYFAFGTFLNEQLTKGQKIESLAHEYLNLFRFPSFLRRIYDSHQQTKDLAGGKKGFVSASLGSRRDYAPSGWETLVHELILKSNYNTNVLFNQRLRDYKNKALFKVINGNTVTEFTWEKSASLVKSYRNAFHSLIKKDPSSSANGRTSPGQTKVAFLLENCLEMALLDLACLTGGIVNVMIPETQLQNIFVSFLSKVKLQF